MLVTARGGIYQFVLVNNADFSQVLVPAHVLLGEEASACNPCEQLFLWTRSMLKVD